MTWAGQLRERVRFEPLIVADGGDGNAESTWNSANPIATVDAAIKPIRGKEEVLAGKLSGVQPYEIVIRSWSATRLIKTSDRAVIARVSAVFQVGQSFDITAIEDPDGSGSWLSILCTSGKPTQG